MKSTLAQEKEIIINKQSHVSADKVHNTLSKHMLADGFEIVLDLKRSKGIKLVDELSNDEYLDFFTFFASSPLGLNHPVINSDEVKKILGEVSVNKPSNSDIYTTYMAEFVETFARIAKPDYMKYLFFIAGGALAVENGLKVAFDWKVRKNLLKGIKAEKGHQVIHFKEAFHGRSGYTMSLTNTDPTKVKYFPKFNWPRIINPKIIFPLEEHLDDVIKLENQALEEINIALKSNPDDIAAIIIEPIQAEGGDNFFRREFFLKLREVADENEMLLIFDEVQTGFGLTGKFWASEYYVKPDIIVFGKKAQVCGIMVSDRIDDIDDHCFKTSSRINSTWGANLTDMVRSKFIMEVIENEKLVENSKSVGDYLKSQLMLMQEEFPVLLNNTRGLGLMCSFDFPSKELRDKFRSLAMKEKLVILGCGEKSIRFRPPLNITKEELNEGLIVIKKVLKLMLTNN
jgi:L-lysine 6-transaminase